MVGVRIRIKMKASSKLKVFLIIFFIAIFAIIAARHFQKTFVLADGVEVSGASLENGLLNVFLLRKNLQPKVKTIKINSNN